MASFARPPSIAAPCAMHASESPRSQPRMPYAEAFVASSAYMAAAVAHASALPSSQPFAIARHPVTRVVHQRQVEAADAGAAVARPLIQLHRARLIPRDAAAVLHLQPERRACGRHATVARLAVRIGGADELDRVRAQVE